MDRRRKVELFEQIRREYRVWSGNDPGSGEEAGGASADGAAGAGECDSAGAQDSGADAARGWGR